MFRPLHQSAVVLLLGWDCVTEMLPPGSRSVR
jgi:hypothetical protein